MDVIARNRVMSYIIAKHIYFIVALAFPDKNNKFAQTVPLCN